MINIYKGHINVESENPSLLKETKINTNNIKGIIRKNSLL